MLLLFLVTGRVLGRCYGAITVVVVVAEPSLGVVRVNSRALRGRGGTSGNCRRDHVNEASIREVSMSDVLTKGYVRRSRGSNGRPV
jgi:hypothetical protein